MPRIAYLSSHDNDCGVNGLTGQLAELVKQVQAGNEVLLTQGKQPVARLVPMGSPPKRRHSSALRIPSLPGKWIGEAVLKSGDLADEMSGDCLRTILMLCECSAFLKS